MKNTIFVACAVTLLMMAASAGAQGFGPGEGHGTCAFIDENGDGFNDLAPDHDGDGIPNGQDPDYVKPEDGSGSKHQYGHRDGRQYGKSGGLMSAYAFAFAYDFAHAFEFAHARGHGAESMALGLQSAGHRYGPGDGTGNVVGPADGTGFGPGPNAGNGSGTGDCDGSGDPDGSALGHRNGRR